MLISHGLYVLSRKAFFFLMNISVPFCLYQGKGAHLQQCEVFISYLPSYNLVQVFYSSSAVTLDYGMGCDYIFIHSESLIRHINMLSDGFSFCFQALREAQKALRPEECMKVSWFPWQHCSFILWQVIRATCRCVQFSRAPVFFNIC